MFSQAGAITDASLVLETGGCAAEVPSQIFTPISTNLRYCIDDLEASVTYYDNDGLPNDPVTVLTRAEEGEEGGEGEGEGGDEPQAQPVEPWISNVSATYKGITFEVTDNDSGFARIADLTLFIEDAKGEITKSVLTVTQGIALPALKLDSNAETYEGYAQDCAVPATTNNLVPCYSDQIGYDVAYDVPVAEGAEWLSEPMITDDGLTFSLAKNEGSEPVPPRSAQLHRRIGRLRFGLVQNHPEALSHRCRLRDRTRNDRARSRWRAISRDSWSATPTARTSFRVPRPNSSSFDRGENDRTGLYRIDGRPLRFLPEIRLLRRQHAGPLLEGAPLPERGHARKEELPRVLHHHGTYRGQHPRNLDARRVQDSGQDEDDRRTHRRRHLHAGVGHQPRNHVQGRRLHQLHRRLFVPGQHQPDRHGYRPALGRGPADVLRQHGPDHLHADQYGRSLAAFHFGRDLDFNSVVPQGSGTFRGIVVADDVAPIRFGDLGRYQLRAMTAEEIALTDEPFSKTVVEWNWNDRKVDLIPEIGEGEINKYGAEQAGASDFNNVVCSGKEAELRTEQKDWWPNGIVLSRQWWDFDADKGQIFRHLVLRRRNHRIEPDLRHRLGPRLDEQHDPLRPGALEPALFGRRRSDVPGRSRQPDHQEAFDHVVVDHVAGFDPGLHRAPAPAARRPLRPGEVVLRLQVADKVTDIDPKATSSNYLTALGIEKGTLTPSVAAGNSQARIGTITVRYN